MKRVAIIVGEEFEDSEFQVPFDRLRDAGVDVTVVGLEEGKELKGKKGKATARVELAIGNANANSFDALVIPGGHSPDKLRTDPLMVAFTRAFADANKPIAAICHAGSMLIEAGIAYSRTLTSWPSIKTDLINAGAQWVDQEVVEDGNVITSRKPEDLDAFTGALLAKLGVASRVKPAKRAA